MEFTIKERLIMLFTLPDEGDITSLRILRKLREDFSFSEEEHKEFNLKMVAGESPTWDYDNFTKKEITVGEKATDIIVDTLKKLDREKKLKSDHISIWEMFIKD